MTRVGVIRNPRSHRNRGSDPATPAEHDVLVAAPATTADLTTVLADFAARHIEVLIIDGGDGTIREVLSRAPALFGGVLPKLAVLPSGKTNALAIDLGLPKGWGLDDCLAAIAGGRLKTRTALEILREGEAQPELRGFLFGAGAFVKATQLAQRAHKAGAFGSPAVAITIAAALRRTFFGRQREGWRAGDSMALDGAPPKDRFMVLAATLKRLPLGVKPFGEPREGLRLLDVDAPPSRLHAALPALLKGSEASWLEASGYRRRDVDAFDLTLDGPFVIDGEVYPGGRLTVRNGAPLAFVVP